MPGLKQLLAGFARADHHVPDLPLLVGRRAEHGGTRDVGAILVHVAENLDADDVALLDLLVGRHAIGDAAANTRADLVLQAVAAAIHHLVVDQLADRLLGHARLDLGQHLAGHAVGQRADLAQDRDLLVGLDHAACEVEVLAGDERRLRQPLRKADVILRRHEIEFDRDPAAADAGFLQRVGQNVSRVLGELVVGADVAEARTLPREILLDVDDDLRREAVAREDRDGAAEAITRPGSA